MAEAKQVVLPPITDETVLRDIDRLARRYVDARGLGMEILDRVGGGGEQLIQRSFELADIGFDILRQVLDCFSFQCDAR